MNLLALYRAWARRRAAGELAREGERLGFYDTRTHNPAPRTVLVCPDGCSSIAGATKATCHCGAEMVRGVMTV